MGGGRTRLIRISGDSPFTEEPGSAIWPEDLNIRRWFSKGSRRTRLSAMPTDITFALRNNYSIVTSKCTHTTINRALHDKWGLHIRGHVIVLRHGARNWMRVMNVHPAERQLIDLVVRKYASPFKLVRHTLTLVVTLPCFRTTLTRRRRNGFEGQPNAGWFSSVCTI